MDEDVDRFIALALAQRLTGESGQLEEPMSFDRLVPGLDGRAADGAHGGRPEFDDPERAEAWLRPRSCSRSVAATPMTSRWSWRRLAELLVEQRVREHEDAAEREVERSSDAAYRGTRIAVRMGRNALEAAAPDQKSAIKLLDRHGWTQASGGQHVVKMVKPGSRPITLPEHKGADYSLGLTRAILRQAGIDPKEL